MPSNIWFRRQNVSVAVVHHLKCKKKTNKQNIHFFRLIPASNKKLQRINISVCPNGIETFDVVTGETLHRISIYKISYCSADAAHSNVFAFIAGIGDDSFEGENEALKCYAYICPNRKIARKLTLTVAKSFQQAYDLWSKSEKRRKSIAESSVKLQTAVTSEKRRQSESQIIIDPVAKKTQQRNLLIDFNEDSSSESVSPESQAIFFQNTWISFEETPGSP